MKSIPPVEYVSLPILAPPAAYICVIRDVDSDRFRIQGTDHPKSLVDALMAERNRQFGIELITILETDDISGSEARLYERHHAELGEQWLALDAYQLRELKRSELQVYTYSSHYISPRSALTVERVRPISNAATQRRERAQAPTREHGVGRKPWARQPLSSFRYGASALRRRRGRASQALAETRSDERSRRQAVEDAMLSLWTNHTGKCLALLALLLLISWATHDYACPNPGTGC